MPALIEIQSLTKIYQLGDVQVQALDDVTVSIAEGEFVAVMGVSGSGKSTLMNILGCLDKPTRGRYLLGGIDIGSLDERELAAIRSRRVGFVFQSFNLLARTSALENVELPLFYSSWSSEGARRASGLLAELGLQNREQNHPNQLSGGQQQRVAIARALVNRPSILLADEPTGNLDSRTSAEILEIFRRLNRDQGLTVILVTHEPDLAQYADRVITFRDGKIISDRQINAPANDRPRASSQEMSAGDTSQTWSSFAAMAWTAAARALRRNKLRAALTMLGIFIGVAAVVAMVAVGEGARSSVAEKIRSLGTDLLIVTPGTTTTSGVHAGAGSNSRLTVADAEALSKEAGAFSLVTYTTRQAAQVVNGNRNWNTIVTGTGANYLAIRDWPLEAGRSFTEDEARNAADVCLLGRTVVENLFGENENPLDAIIRVKDVPLRVIGVLSAKGQSSLGHDQDDVVLIPFETAERKVLGVAGPSAQFNSPGAFGSQFNFNTVRTSAFGSPPRITGKVNAIYVKAASSDLLSSGVDQIRSTLRGRHHLAAGRDDDFTVRNLLEIEQASEEASRVMTILLAAVGSISLLVGGIGIMNIMLVSVTERTREIGIRIAIGARRIHILLQFLIEAVLLSMMGGLAGVISGAVVSKLISAFAQWPTLLSPAAVVGSFLFSAAIGVFFGYYPARQASLLDPIDALRYE